MVYVLDHVSMLFMVRRWWIVYLMVIISFVRKLIKSLVLRVRGKDGSVEPWLSVSFGEKVEG